ncbi:MAG: class I SAM-dependent methyltransferase [Caulobacterales bacterium]
MPWRETIPAPAPAPSDMPQFGGWAALYHRYRPQYPPHLYALLAQTVAGRGVCVELGAGTGQATLDLKTMFSSVIAVEPDAAMAGLIPVRQGLAVIQAPAESALIASGEADAVVVATALHWMDVPRVLARAAGWLKPGGVFFACTFATSQYPGAPPAATSVMRRYSKMWRSHMHERLSSWQPAEAYFLAAPDYEAVQSFEIYTDFHWSPAEVAGFLMTTSFAQAFAAGDGEAILAELTRDLEIATDGAGLAVRFPIEGAWTRRRA